MRQEEETYFQEGEIHQSVHRFEEMERSKLHAFFDVHEFEQIVDFYTDNGLLKKANEAVRFGLLQHPDSISLQLRKAQVMLFRGKYKQSLILLSKISRIEYTNYEVFVSLGIAYNLLGKTKDALKYFEKAFSLEPEDKGEIASQIAFSFQVRENFKEAIKYFSLALEYEPGRATCLLELGNCHKLLSEYSEAEQYYKKYLDHEPFAYIAWFFLGITLKYQNRYQEALEALDFSLAINDQYENACLIKADILFQLERYDEAIESYQRVIAIVPEEVIALVPLGQSCLYARRLVEAEKYLTLAKDIDPSYPDIYNLLGEVLKTDDRVEQSLSYFKEACSLDPGNASFWFSYAEALTEAGRLTEAQTALKKAIRTEPGEMDYREALAQNYCEEGRFLKAADILEEGFNFSEPNAWFLYFLGSYRILGREINRGLQAIEEALQLDFYMYEEISIFQPKVFNKKEVLKLIAKYKNQKS